MANGSRLMANGFSAGAVFFGEADFFYSFHATKESKRIQSKNRIRILKWKTPWGGVPQNEWVMAIVIVNVENNFYLCI
ncbi:MAG: hypothetical protein ACI30R_05520 [Sodaliphilus sp.]